MSRKSFLLILIFLSINSVGASKKEELVFNLPSNFTEGYRSETERGSSIEYVPEGETVNKWSEIITIFNLKSEKFNSIKDVEAFHGQLSTTLNYVCADLSYSKPQYDKKEEAFTAEIYCGTSKRHGMWEYTHMKYFNSEKGLYSIRRTKKLTPYKDKNKVQESIDRASWDKFFQDIHLRTD